MRSISFLNFPVEIKLMILESLPYQDLLGTHLREVHKGISDLLDTYETSISRSVLRNQLANAVTDFPACANPNYWDLRRCARRYYTMESIVRAWLICQSDEYSAQNMAVAETGLIILWRLMDKPTHSTRAAYLLSLRRDPLIALFLALHFCNLAAVQRCLQFLRPGSNVKPVFDLEFRALPDAAIGFFEGAFQWGPEFILRNIWEDEVDSLPLLLLYHDFCFIWPEDWHQEFFRPKSARTQGPMRNPDSRVDLVDVILSRLCDSLRCIADDVPSVILESVRRPVHSLSHIGAAGREKILRNENIAGDDG